jgi:hypothetical protein
MFKTPDLEVLPLAESLARVRLLCSVILSSYRQCHPIHRYLKLFDYGAFCRVVLRRESMGTAPNNRHKTDRLKKEVALEMDN